MGEIHADETLWRIYPSETPWVSLTLKLAATLYLPQTLIKPNAMRSKQLRNKWGVKLNGLERDRHLWAVLLKLPFDPFVQEVKDERGNYLALRSSAFDGLETSADVHQAAKQQFTTPNVAMSKHADTDPVTNGSVVKFLIDGPPRRHYFLETETAAFRARFGMGELTLKDAQGNVVEPPPEPSKAQLWMHAVCQDPQIGPVLRYLDGKSGWFEMYKAFEAVRSMPNGGIPKSEVKRFTQTANAGQRHHPNETTKSHKHPMELWEASALITEWVSAAIDATLLKSAKS